MSSASSSVATVSQPAANSAVNAVDVTLYGTVRFTAAGAGAVLTLFDDDYRQKAQDLVRETEVLELALHPDFQEIFIKSLAFP